MKTARWLCGQCLWEAEKRKKIMKLRAVVLLQEFTALAGRVHTEYDDHGQENDGWQNRFHKILHLYAEMIHPLL